MTDKLQAWCEALGWRADVRSGRLDGVHIEVRRPPSDNNAVFEILARLDHPIDVGLDVGIAGSLATSPHPTGDPAFDGIFVAQVAPDESAHVPALLAEPVRAALQALAVAGYPRVDDGAVRFHFDGMTAGLDEFSRHVNRCVEIVRSLAACADTLPAPRGLVERGLVDPLLDAARRMGLAVRRNALTLAGDTASGRFLMRWNARSTRVAAAGYTLEVRFHEPLTAGLRVEPATAGDRLRELVGLGDVHLGDDAFDRAWTVRARDVDAARDALNTAARDALDRMARAGLELTLTDEGLTGHSGIPASPDAATEVLRLADELRERLRPRVAEGPYR